MFILHCVCETVCCATCCVTVYERYIPMRINYVQVSRELLLVILLPFTKCRCFVKAYIICCKSVAKISQMKRCVETWCCKFLSVRRDVCFPGRGSRMLKEAHPFWCRFQSTIQTPDQLRMLWGVWPSTRTLWSRAEDQIAANWLTSVERIWGSLMLCLVYLLVRR